MINCDFSDAPYIDPAAMPILSFVIMARNDDYMGNAKWRLETTLNFLSESLFAIGRLNEAEIVVVDWQSNIPLYKDLSVSDKSKQIIRYIIVPETLPGTTIFKCDFPRPVILNVGIRRSRGQYIVQTLGDVLWTEDTLLKLFNLIEKKTLSTALVDESLIVIGRKELPYDMVKCNPSIDCLATYIKGQDSIIEDIPPTPYLLVPADSFMMHRNLWFECRAFDERLQYWGWSDCDLILRMRLKYSVICKKDFEDLHVYHLNHISPEHVEVINTRKTNPWLFNNFTVNLPEWGLAATSFHEYPSSSTALNLAETVKSPVFISVYRLRHLLNILIFFVSNINWPNTKLVILLLLHMCVSFPELKIRYRARYLFTRGAS